MSNEKLENALYEKMAAEQQTFREKLLRLSPEEVLEKSREYVTRDNILKVLGEYPGTEMQTKTLLKSHTPLTDIYAEMEKQGSDYGINEIKDCVALYTDAILAAEAEKQRAMWKLPIYSHPASYAYEHGQIDQYRASYRANVACRDAIGAAITEHYYDNRLHNEAVRKVVDTFGYDRTLYVLANTIRHKEHDGRISLDNKAWAKTVAIYEDGGTERGSNSIYYSVENAHPGLLNLFVDMARHDWQLNRPLTAEEIRAEAQRLLEKLKAPAEPNSPNGTHFMAQVSPDFMARASSRDTTALSQLLPFRSLALNTMKDRKGIFAVIAGNENRGQKLREPRPSVLEKLQKPLPETSPNISAKSREEEL